MFGLKISKDALLNFIGFLLIFLFLLRTFSLFRGESIVNLFWLCNHIPLVLGLAILFRSPLVAIGEVSLLLFGYLNWVIDYIFKMFFDIYIFGTTEYLFPIQDVLFFSITTTVHFLTIPLGIIALFLMGKTETNAWRVSFIHAVLLVPFVIYFGKEHNLNCLLEPCVNWISNFSLYPLLFFFAYIFLIVIPINYLTNKIIILMK